MGREQKRISACSLFKASIYESRATRLLRYHHGDEHPPVEVALWPRSTDRQRECLTLSQTPYQITFSAQDQVGDVLSESAVPSQSLDSLIPPYD